MEEILINMVVLVVGVYSAVKHKFLAKRALQEQKKVLNYIGIKLAITDRILGVYSFSFLTIGLLLEIFVIFL